MQVFPCGTIVTTVLGTITGMITSVSIHFERVSYEVSYFDGVKQVKVWMNEMEFGTSVAKDTIGFKPNI